MAFYTEGLLWYLLLIDVMIYNYRAWKNKDQGYHWISQWLPLNRFTGFVYLSLILWVGFTLYRMQLIIFW